REERTGSGLPDVAGSQSCHACQGTRPTIGRGRPADQGENAAHVCGDIAEARQALSEGGPQYLRGNRRHASPHNLAGGYMTFIGLRREVRVLAMKKAAKKKKKYPPLILASGARPLAPDVNTSCR